MITESSKEALPALEKAYKKLVNDKAVADATVDAFLKVFEKVRDTPVPADSALLYTIEKAMINLFAVQSYGDFDTWTKLIPTENSTPEEYAAFFMLTENDDCIYRKNAAARGPLAWRDDLFLVQIPIDHGYFGFDYTWFLDGKLLSDSDKQYLKDLMEEFKESKSVELQIDLVKNLETTTKKMIFVYGEDDPWTGAAIPDPTNPNVKKYIIPHGVHTDNLEYFTRYKGGAEVTKQFLDDVIENMK